MQDALRVGKWYFWQLNLTFSFGYKVIEAVRLATSFGKWGILGKISLLSLLSNKHGT